MILLNKAYAYPYQNGIFRAYCSIEGSVIGGLIISSRSPITAFEEDMSDIIIDMLHLYQKKLSVKPVINEYTLTNQVFLDNLLDGINVSRAEVYLREINHLSEDNHYHIIVLHTDSDILLPSIEKSLKSHIKTDLIVQKEKQLVMLSYGTIFSALSEKIYRDLKHILKNVPVICGISNVFQDLTYCKHYYRQAKTAAESKQSKIVYFQSLASEYILQAVDNQTKYYARHPLVFCLEKRDRQEKTDFVNTLREYLLCERSTRRAAEHLFIHRNTLQYRINAIKDLNMVDLEDDYERQYLLLSLLFPLPTGEKD